MTTRLIGTLVIVTATLVAAATPRAQTQAGAPAPVPAQSPTPSPPPTQSPPQTPAPSPDAVYAIGRDRVAAPRVQREVKPAYTPEAMRNRIQGRVRLQGVVERDGTVSGITVVQSLDTQFGLDQSAVDALKQWRFQPGTLVDGTPVRVLVNVDLTFTLRSGPPTQAWPDGFADATSLPGAVDEVAESQGLRLRISRPAAWGRRAGPPSEWVGLQSADSSESVGVVRPDTTAFDLGGVPSEAQVQRLIDGMRRLQASPQVETLATGQVQSSPGVLWVWSTFRIPTVSSIPGAPQNGLAGEVRSWVFARTVNGKVVLVQCALILPRDIDPAALSARVRQAAADFAPIVKSISVDAIAN